MTVAGFAGRLGVVVVVALSAAACGSGDDGVESRSGPTTTSEERSPRFSDQSARPDVSFDPCLDIPDDGLRALGLDPSTKSFADEAGSDRTFLICAFTSAEYPPNLQVNIISSNSTYDEYVAKEAGNDLHEYELDGRRTVTKRTAPGVNCVITVETSNGILGVTRNIYESDLTEEQACQGIDDTARTLLSYQPGSVN